VDSNDFNCIFHPFRKRHLKQTVERDLFGNVEPQWIAAGYLSNYLIHKALNGAATLAYFKTTYTDSFAVDIDVHEWHGLPLFAPDLQEKTRSVVERIGYSPSIAVETPHGIHLYYFFAKRAPLLKLYNIVEELLGDLDVEILPTNKKALRIPSEFSYLDPETFEPIDAPTEFNRYPVTILFGDSKDTHEKQAHRGSWRRVFNVKAKEAEHFPLINHHTNRAVVECGIAYHLAGIPIEQAVDRFHELVLKSPGYTRDLRNKARVMQRFSAIYAHQFSYVPSAKVSQISLLNAITVNRIIELAPFAPQRKEPLRRFFYDLLIWNDYILGLQKNDPAIHTYMCSEYSYFRKNVRVGYIPLPYTLLSRWNGHYASIIEWAVNFGLLEPFDTKTSKRGSYSKVLHSCKYYRVHPDKLF